ncbi:MAG: lysophospholipid acyltransferase family protein [Planctomycetota bacterium]
MKIPPKLIGWPIAAAILAFRWTCRVRLHGIDPRPAMRARGEKYVFSILHAHQIAIIAFAERNTAAMVSRSADGELLQPVFRVLGVVPQRGSNGRGGTAALDAMVEHVDSGAGPALIAVDGPRGPRGQVRKGIAALSKRTDATVLNVVVVPRWRLTFRGAWDRFQVPLPFSRIDAYFAEPIRPQPNESVEELRRRIEHSLNGLEQQHDPTEAIHTSCDRQGATSEDRESSRVAA